MSAEKIKKEPTLASPAISDELWELAKAKLTKAIRAETVRPFLEALAHRSRTKCTWRELPESFGRWHKIYVRYVNWSEKAHFRKMRRLLGQHGVDIGQARADAHNLKYGQAKAAEERRKLAGEPARERPSKTEPKAKGLAREG